MNVLALNCGSSSVKFRLVAVEPGAPPAAGRALAERTEAVRDGDHAAAVQHALELARRAGPIEAVGHRVVHGGPRFTAPALIDDAVIDAIEALEVLAPLHNRPSLAGIRACRDALGAAIPMVAVFDTAFHAGLPEAAARYAIPWELAERHGIRRFGFHGISYAWATARAATLLGRAVADLKLVVLHLGSGCSAAAIRGGVSVDTSMGLTPLEGLVMGTRSGDLDPAILGVLMRGERVSLEQVEDWLNEGSGLKGLAGSADTRDLLAREASDPRARLALDIFCHRVAEVPRRLPRRPRGGRCRRLHRGRRRAPGGDPAPHRGGVRVVWPRARPRPEHRQPRHGRRDQPRGLGHSRARRRRRRGTDDRRRDRGLHPHGRGYARS